MCAIICIDSGLPLTNGHPRMPWLRRVSSSPVVCSWLAVCFKPQPHAPSASFRQRISIEIPEYFARRSCTLGGEKKRENRDISLYMLTSRPPNYRSRLSASTLGTIKTAKLEVVRFNYTECTESTHSAPILNLPLHVNIRCAKCLEGFHCIKCEEAKAVIGSVITQRVAHGNET